MLFFMLDALLVLCADFDKACLLSSFVTVLGWFDPAF